MILQGSAGLLTRTVTVTVLHVCACVYILSYFKNQSFLSVIRRRSIKSVLVCY